MTDKASVTESKSGSPDWADDVVKLPKIPASGPMPTRKARPVNKTKPTLPTPPPVSRPAVKTAPAKEIPVAPAPAAPEPVKPVPQRDRGPNTASKSPLNPAGSPVLPELKAKPIPVEPSTEPTIQVSEKPSSKRNRKGVNRRARLHISRVDPWSVMKISFMFSFAFGIMIFLAVYGFWSVLESGGLFVLVNEKLNEIITNPTDPTSTWHIEDYVSSSKVLGFTALIAAVNVVIMTALGTIAAFLYNLASTAIGGIEVTLSED